MITIAIDGTSASGKSTVAKLISQKYNILHLNTGALYRAIAHYLHSNNINSYDEFLVEKALPNITVSVAFESGSQQTFVNGENVSEKLYSSEMGTLSSVTSAYKAVREKMLTIQRDIAQINSVVMEGRDITSVVLPNAKNKFFLRASTLTRAKRRLLDLQKEGENVSLEQVVSDLEERDNRDSKRTLNPLIIVSDAIVIDTDHLTPEEIVEKMSRHIKE